MRGWRLGRWLLCGAICALSAAPLRAAEPLTYVVVTDFDRAFLSPPEPEDAPKKAVRKSPLRAHKRSRSGTSHDELQRLLDVLRGQN